MDKVKITLQYLLPKHLNFQAGRLSGGSTAWSAVHMR